MKSAAEPTQEAVRRAIDAVYAPGWSRLRTYMEMVDPLNKDEEAARLARLGSQVQGALVGENYATIIRVLEGLTLQVVLGMPPELQLECFGFTLND